LIDLGEEVKPVDVKLKDGKPTNGR
jgi:hypothetical protein